MGFYYKDEMGTVNENHEVASQEAPVTGMDECLANCLKSAAIVALVESYLKCGLKHHAYQTGEEMVGFAKNLCSQALDNGDMTATDAEHIIAWAEQHRMDGEGGAEHCKAKLICHAIIEEMGEVCGDGTCLPGEIAEAVELQKQMRQKCADLSAKYGHVIEGYVADFMRLYGKNFDEHFVQKLGL